MIVVVYSNIVFSALLNTQSLIGDLILNSQGIFKFRTCNFLTKEINLHWKKILKMSKLAEEELQESRRLIYKNIDFIDERQIPLSFRNRGYELTKEIDKKDFVFISLNEFNESLFWTGDKQLINGLRANGYQKVISTDELTKLRINLEKDLKK